MGFCACHMAGTNQDADTLNCTFVDTKYCHRNTWTFSQNYSGRQNKSIFLLNTEPRNSNEEQHEWLIWEKLPSLWERWMLFPDFCAYECGLKKTLLRKQNRLFCSFQSTTICLKQVKNWEELHFPTLRDKERAQALGPCIYGQRPSCGSPGLT